MYKEVALDPSCMSEYGCYVILKREFGFEKGRYISTDRSQWAKEAFHVVRHSDISPVKRKSITNFLNRVRKGKEPDLIVLAADRSGITGNTWNDWWAHQMRYRPFTVTVSENSLQSCINYDEILEGCDLWEVNPSISIEKDAGVIVENLKPLILMSKRILLVDQYFRFSANNTLAELLKVTTDSSINQITIVASMETPNPQEVYDSEYASMNNRSIKFEWIKAPDKFFHDRYFVTDVGAVRSGQGFMPGVSKGAHSDLLNLNLVSKSEADGVVKDFESLMSGNKAEKQYTNK